jgi:hypothetical protein
MQWCIADPGPLRTQQFVTIPGLQRITFVLRGAREKR